MEPARDIATLVINGGSSYCTACGGGALIKEQQHLTLLPREAAGGWVELPRGSARAPAPQEAPRSGR